MAVATAPPAARQEFDLRVAWLEDFDKQSEDQNQLNSHTFWTVTIDHEKFGFRMVESTRTGKACCGHEYRCGTACAT